MYSVILCHQEFCQEENIIACYEDEAIIQQTAADMLNGHTKVVTRHRLCDVADRLQGADKLIKLSAFM